MRREHASEVTRANIFTDNMARRRRWLAAAG
jgi:hypothetical protein